MTWCGSLIGCPIIDFGVDTNKYLFLSRGGKPTSYLHIKGTNRISQFLQELGKYQGGRNKRPPAHSLTNQTGDSIPHLTILSPLQAPKHLEKEKFDRLRQLQKRRF